MNDSVIVMLLFVSVIFLMYVTSPKDKIKNSEVDKAYTVEPR